jgi:hypothetical protein
MNVPEKRPKSFGEYIALLEEYQSKSGGVLWFRGTGKARHPLLPTLYRHKRHRTAAALGDLERQLIVRFRQRSIPFLTSSLADDWDMLFFMQHYGVPTRLLDWTENPFMGLYFAVMSSPFRGKMKAGQPVLSFRSDAAVWMLDPVAWNRHALKHQGFDRGILTPSDETLQSYRPKTQFPEMNVQPVALYGAYNSPRIVAQRGAFTIFGQNLKGMEKAYVKEKFPKSCLTKIVLKRSVLPAMRAAILNHGITESVVFPDLDGLAKEIKRGFEFEF